MYATFYLFVEIVFTTPLDQIKILLRYCNETRRAGKHKKLKTPNYPFLVELGTRPTVPKIKSNYIWDYKRTILHINVAVKSTKRATIMT